MGYYPAHCVHRDCRKLENFQNRHESRGDMTQRPAHMNVMTSSSGGWHELGPSGPNASSEQEKRIWSPYVAEFSPLFAWSAELCINDISCVFQPLMCGWKKNTVNFLQEKSSSDSFSRASFINTSVGKQRTGSDFRMDSNESLRNTRFRGFYCRMSGRGLF